MAVKFMYIPNDSAQNYPFFRLKLMVESLDTKLNEQTNQNSIKSLKLLRKQIRKRYYNTLGTGVIHSPMSPTFLTKLHF